ncbi:MAG: 4Fe-4S binding protein [Candidatus Hodarchaeales archaeon]
MILIIEINTISCVGCAYCAMVCPVDGFKVEGISIFQNKCNKCTRCIYNCPVEAIKPLWKG